MVETDPKAPWRVRRGVGRASIGVGVLLVACQASLGLDDYVIASGASGAGDASGASGGSGSMSVGGSASGAGGGGGLPGAGGDAGDAGGGNVEPGDAGPPACDTTGLAALQAPVLLGPKRGVYTGSLHAEAGRETLRPHFAWGEVGSECPGVVYELELDDSCVPGALDACEFASPELDATGLEGSTFQPETDLPVATSAPVGALYAWRVRACDSGERCSPWSEVRHLFVGRVPEDVNGDGFADVLVPISGGTAVFFGSSQFDQISDARLDPEAYTTVFLGDVNADGFADLGAVVGYAATMGQAPHVLFGGPDVTALAGVTLTASAGTSSTATIIRAAGDINGDGFSDLVVHLNNRSTTDIYFGGTTLSANPSIPLATPLDEFTAIPGSGSAGDVNGDGYDDLVLVVSPALDSAQLLLGGPAPSEALSKPIEFGVSCNFTDISVSGGGDANGDGYDDFFVSCGGGVYAYFGAAEPGSSWAAVREPDVAVLTVASGFDIDLDGLDDVLIGRDAAAPLLFLGKSAEYGFDAPEEGAMNDFYTARLFAIADHNGDGLSDFVVGGYDVSVQRANGDGTLDPQSVGSFVDGAETSIQGNVVY
ncbi:MAG TPA: VCBS repeat-containing protein [Polyangiaceae bacterium]|nr:VCBS repeat-containing protein [Polyangiaceae bacterium]